MTLKVAVLSGVCIADVEVCSYVDDVGGTNHSRHNIPAAWHSQMVSSHIHTNGNRLPAFFSFTCSFLSCLQCFVTVGWASGLKKIAR